VVTGSPAPEWLPPGIPRFLVDSSAWIEYFRRTGSRADVQVSDLVERPEPAAGVTEPVVMELLGGARDSANFRRIRRLTTAMPLCPVLPEVDFTEAGALFKMLRDKGITIRSWNDCLIAAVAWRYEATLVHADADFDRIASRYPVQVMSLI
jgi:predicted nucleic acid-binding protein